MATITSNQTGDWASTSTWVGGSVPAADDLVVISHGHKVTLSTNIQSTRTGNVTINGNLHFASGGKMHLHGRMTVYNASNSNNTAGEFVEGSTTSGSLLSMVGGSEIKISGSNADQHGVQVDARKWCGVDIQGSEPTLVTQLNGAADYTDKYLTVDSVTNFVANDLISVYEREIDWRRNADECFRVHDVDSVNNRIYVRRFIGPKATISSSSGSTITVNSTEAKQFRVGYDVVFGTGDNRNAHKITGISNGVITLSGSVVGTVDGETLYDSGVEIYHADDAYVRRLATTTTVEIDGTDAQRVITVANVSDFSVGDEITLESLSDTEYQYTSGSSNSHWRHNLLYTITEINGNDITVDRDIVYDSIIGCYVIRMTRDIVIKACDTNGDDIAIGDQDTARVFFNVKYWTSNAWYDAPTRRVKIKYVRFKDLGYNTGDDTNFRGGVVIAGYNGRYKADLVGSSHTESTVHTSSGYSQTGENYVDGCTVTAYALCANSTRDGDQYPCLMIRHPYGHVDRNCVIVGTGRGYWRWSTGYSVKSCGHIAMANNYSGIQYESSYSLHNFMAYGTIRMVNNHALMFQNFFRESDRQLHFGCGYYDIQNVGYAMRFAAVSLAPVLKRVLLNRYRQVYYTDTSSGTTTMIDSQITPNLWDMTRKLYGDGGTGLYRTNQALVKYGTSYNDFDLKSNNIDGRIRIYNNRFGIDSFPIIAQGETMIFKETSKEWRLFWTVDDQGDGSTVSETIFIEGGTVVKLETSFKITTEYDGTGANVGIGDYPRLEAQGGPYGYQGKYKTSLSDTSSLTSSDTNISAGWKDTVQFDSDCIGNWQTKSLIIPAQPVDYYLTYGIVLRDNDLGSEESFMKPIKVTLSKASPFTSLNTGSDSISIISVKEYNSGTNDFSSNKRRISGRI